MKEGKSEFIY